MGSRDWNPSARFDGLDHKGVHGERTIAFYEMRQHAHNKVVPAPGHLDKSTMSRTNASTSSAVESHEHISRAPPGPTSM